MKNIVKKVMLRLGAPEVSDKYEIPKIPTSLQKVTTKRDAEYLKYIKQLLSSLGRDPMTGLLTKQHFEQLDKDRGVYLYIDGDGLKKINDNLGHAAGTAAIEALSQGIKSAVRGRDEIRVSRLGGDEFVVFVEDVSIATGVKIAKRILDSIHQQKISNFFKGSEDLKKKLDQIDLKASIGVGKNEEDADAALYSAKGRGRDRIEFFKGKTH